MDQEPIVPKGSPKEKQQAQQIQQPTSGLFMLAGQLQTNKQFQAKQFDGSAYTQSATGLVCLYSGFPSLSAKTNATTLTRFGVQYSPAKNDLVIGIVKVRTAETFIVDIGAPMDGILGGLQFDGATKRNKPNLKTGTLIFGRVVEYSKHTGGKLSCVNKGFSNKKNNEMGELKQGYMFWIPQYQHHYIQTNLLQKLGKCVKFEVAFGKNGRIWIKSVSLENTMVLANIFKLAVNDPSETKINSMIALLK